jgi:hypothetical protein
LTRLGSVLHARGGRVVLALGAFQTIAFAAYFTGSVYDVPFWDTLDWIDTLYRSPGAAPWLWQQHGEIRMVVTKALIALDLWLFDGGLVPIALVAFLGVLAAAAALARATLRSVSEPGARGFCVGALFILCFQTFTLPSYMATNTLHHALVAAFFLLALVLVADTDAGARVPWWRVAAAMLAAALASLSHANGFLAWPIVAWAGWRRGLAAGHVGAIFLAGGALGLAYFAGLQPATDHPDPLRSLGAPADLARFVVEFFGSPWVKLPVLYPFGVFVGLLITALAVLALARIGLSRRGGERTTIIAAAVLAFALGSALMIGLGRMGLADLRQGGTRYGIYAALSHVALAMLAFAAVDRAWHRARARLAIVAAALVVAVPLGAQQVVIGETAESAGRAIRAAGAALRAGSDDPELLSKIYPDPDRAAAIVSRLRQRQVYGFGEPEP